MTLLILAGLLGCNKAEEVLYEQYNHDNDILTVSVGTEDILDPVSIDLYSSSGLVVIGSSTIDPGGGPIGTEHEIQVVILDDYKEDVARVSLRTDSPGRGEDEYDLDQDSAEEGYFKTILESVGEPGEQRTDDLTIRVWSAIETDETEDDTTTEE